MNFKLKNSNSIRKKNTFKSKNGYKNFHSLNFPKINIFRVLMTHKKDDEVKNAHKSQFTTKKRAWEWEKMSKYEIKFIVPRLFLLSITISKWLFLVISMAIFFMSIIIAVVVVGFGLMPTFFFVLKDSDCTWPTML